MKSEEKSVLDLFYEKVRIYGDKKAVVLEKSSITYAQLDRMSSILAERLEDMGVGQRDFILLYAQKSIEMMVAVFAVLKVGAVYVPVDMRYPKERIEYMLSDCHPKVVLTYRTILFCEVPCMEICLETEGEAKHYSGDRNRLDYCIYTSGTMGKPKGVLIYDRSVVNLVCAYKRIYGIVPDDILLQFASIAFDQAVWDIFTILTTGGTLCLLPPEFDGDIDLTENYIIEQGVSIAAFTPAYLRELDPEKLRTMRVVESGGDKVERNVVEKWKRYCRVFNTYGPTEATVNALTYELGNEIPKEIPIGKPIDNMEAYIVDADGNLCEDNCVGELCLSGIGLAHGYLNNEELTKQKFIPNPFGSGKLYKTGDLAKKLADGNIVCIGRIDRQVKIRGFRVDIGEVEHAMFQYGKVAVMAEKNQLNDDILVAFLVSSISKECVQKELERKLPDYMIPSKIFYLPKIPLTINGKVDDAQLRHIFHESLEQETVTCLPPETDIEKKIVTEITDVLHLPKFGINWNFVENGGNSINAIRVVARLKKAGYCCTVRDLLLAKDLKDLARILSVKQKAEKGFDCTESQKMLEKIKLIFGDEATSVSPITPTQGYMYRAYQEHIIGDNFLQYIYRINGRYDFRALRKAISLLPQQYDSLSSRFLESEQEVFQITFTNVQISVCEIQVSSEDEVRKYMREDVLRSFDIEKETLIRFTVFLFPDCLVKLLCSVSHMIVDGWSMDLLIRTLDRNYQMLLSGTSVDQLSKIITLIKCPSVSSYNWFLYGLELNEMKEYWNQYFKGSEEAVFTIPHDIHNIDAAYRDVVQCIEEEDCLFIRKVCYKLGITENSLFETAFAVLQNREDLRHRKDILFTKVVSGRDLAIEGIEYMVGTLINIIPQRILLTDDFGVNVRNVDARNVKNMLYDKMDFYRTEICGRRLMDEIQTMIVFCNYYDGSVTGFEYELDKDQDNIDLSLYIDSLQNKYRLYLTCKGGAYSEERAVYLMNSFVECVRDIAYELSYNF